MAVSYCHVCQQRPEEKGENGRQNLEEGDYCPVCNQPACRRHLSIVRWRWRDSGAVDSALICKECVRSYAHRSWDVFRRDWIT